MSTTSTQNGGDPMFDAVIIGAGFSGMYLLHRLRDDLKMNVRCFEKGAGVGGTWYWNRYPGARCDADSIFYSYSFDKDLEQEWTWTERWATQAEILAYCNHVAERLDLLRSITFDTEVTEASFDEQRAVWIIKTATETVTARYLVSAVGCLSASQVPDFPGLTDYQGGVYHTGRWPHEGVDLS